MPKPPSPQAFIGGPSIHPPQHGRRVVEVAALPRSVPALTICASGFINPNREAADLLSSFAAGVCLHGPEKVRAGRTPKPWELSAGTCHLLYTRKEKPGHRRFWVDPGQCPPPGRYILAPIAHQPERFRLVAL